MAGNRVTDTTLSKTIASTATLKIANIHSEDLFYTPIESASSASHSRRALHVPVAAITLLNEEKQWFKSAAGWGISELPRSQSICRLTVEENGLLTIDDAREDPRVANSSIVASAPHFRAYAGHPLSDEHGAVCGTFCVLDVKPRQFTAADRQAITDLPRRRSASCFPIA
jgi:GAF domain-containing protein